MKLRPWYPSNRSNHSLAYPTVTLPANEGALTEPLSNQKRFVKAVVAASLQAGLVPADALKRATDAVVWIRGQAIECKFDSEDQDTVKMFVVAGMRANGVSNGVTMAQRGIEAMRLMNDWLKVVRKDERAKAKQGKQL